MDYSIVGSDAASDFAHNVADAVAAVCQKELKDKGNRYNSPGFINVALLIEAMIATSPEVFIGHDKMRKVAVEAGAMLDRVLAELNVARQKYERQQEQIKAGKPIKPKDRIIDPPSEHDIRRLRHLHKTIRRYIEDCND